MAVAVLFSAVTRRGERQSRSQGYPLVWVDSAATSGVRRTQIRTWMQGSAKLIVEARTAGIDLVDPVKLSNGRQARTNNGYATSDFAIDWDTQTVTCPQGKTSTRWIDSG